MGGIGIIGTIGTIGVIGIIGVLGLSKSKRTFDGKMIFNEYALFFS